MGIADKEGGLPIFDTDILNTIFLPTAKFTSRLTGKIGAHLPAAEEFNP